LSDFDQIPLALVRETDDPVDFEGSKVCERIGRSSCEPTFRILESFFSHKDPRVAPARIRERADAIEKGDMRILVSDAQAARVEKRLKENVKRLIALQESDMM